MAGTTSGWFTGTDVLFCQNEMEEHSRIFGKNIPLRNDIYHPHTSYAAWQYYVSACSVDTAGNYISII